MRQEEKIDLKYPVHPKQKLLLKSKGTEILFGGAAGGSKSHGSRLCCIAWSLAIPGLSVYLFRREYRDLQLNHMSGPTGFRSMLQPLVSSGKAIIRENEIEFYNGSKIYLCNCFAGETLVQTTLGDIKIKDLVGKTGYIKVTKSLDVPFENVRMTRKSASLVTVRFEDGTFYRCTPDHRFLTKAGFVQAKDLAGKSCLTNQSQFSAKKLRSLKEKNLTKTPSAIITATVADLVDYFIAQFGSITIARSQKDSTFTTSMKTRTTTGSKISSSLKEENIEGFTPEASDSNNKQHKQELKPTKHQENGTLRQKVTSGIKSRLSEYKLTRLIKSANNAASRLRDSQTLDIDPVQRAAGLNCNEEKESFNYKKCKSVDLGGVGDVYCMTVPDAAVFPLSNGVLVSNCQHEKDVFGYQGSEMHVLIIEETTQFTEFQIRYLRSRVRLPEIMLDRIPQELKGCFPRIIYPTNPGGISHQYLKRAFIDGKDPYEYYRAPDEDGGFIRQFIPSKLTDNPSVNPVEYAKRLAGIGSEQYVRALLDGDWNAIVGAFLPEFSDQHIIPNFTIPKHWFRFRSFDWGYAEPFACTWWAVSDGKPVEEIGFAFPEGCLICYREFYGCNPNKTDEGLRLTNEQICQGILNRTKDEYIYATVTDSLPFQGRGGKTIAEVFAENGVTLVRADTDRKQGSAQLRNRLVGHGPMPDMLFMAQCVHTIRTLPTVQTDPLDPEDSVDKGEVHIFDTCRYAAMTRPIVKQAPATPRFISEMKYGDALKEHLKNKKVTNGRR